MADNPAQEYDKLNPAVAPTPEGQFLNYSKGLDVPSIAGDFLKGVGETFKDAVVGTDNLFKEVIRNQATDAVDNIRERQTEFLMGGRNPGDAEVPSDIKKAGNYLSNLKTAKDQGMLNQAYYNMNLDSVAKDLRARYPSYREHIDNVIHDLTGVTPANKVIQDLFHATTAGADKETTAIYAYMKEYTDLGHGSEIAEYRAKTGGNPPLDWLMTRVSAIKGPQVELERQKSELSFKEANNKATEETYTRTARADVRNSVANALKRGGDGVGTGSLFADKEDFDTSMQKAAEYLKTNPTLPPEMQQHLLQSANIMHQNIMGITEARLSDPRYAAGLTEKAKKDIREESEKMSEIARAGLGADGKVLPGYIGLAKTLNDSMQKGDDFSLAMSSKILRAEGAAQRIAGRDALNSVLLENNKNNSPDAINLNNTSKAISKWIGLSMITGADDPKTGEKAAKLSTIDDKFIQATGDKVPGAVLNGLATKGREFILDRDKLLKDDKAAEGMFRSLYDDNGGNVLRVIKEADRYRFFNEMASPEMAQRAMDLDKVSPGLKDIYKKWTIETSTALSRETVSSSKELQDSIYANKGNGGVQFDPTTMTFSPVRSNIPFVPGGPVVHPFNEAAADKLNQVIAPVVKVMQLDGSTPEAIQEAVGTIMRVGGIDLPRITKQPPASESGAPGGNPGRHAAPGLVAPKDLTQQVPEFNTEAKTETDRVPEANNDLTDTAKEAFKDVPGEDIKSAAEANQGTLTEADKAAKPTGPMRSDNLQIVKRGDRFYVVPHRGNMDANKINQVIDEMGLTDSHKTLEEAQAEMDHIEKAFGGMKRPAREFYGR